MKASAFIIILILLNISAHFIPFERASLGNDDYAIMMKAKCLSVPEILSSTLKQPDRPIAYTFLMLQEKISEKYPVTGLMLMAVMTSLVLAGVFYLLKTIFENDFLAVAGATFFCLIPNKLEVYHVPVYAIGDLANIFFILSLILAVNYAKGGKARLFIISIISYIIGIFTYEPGLLLPVVVFFYYLLFNKRKMRYSLFWFLPMLFYLVFKFTNAFGFGEINPLQRHMPSLAMVPVNLLDAFHQYFGRYILRSILYGFYKFPSMEAGWLFIALVFDIVFIVLFFRWLKKCGERKINLRYALFGLVMFTFFLAPIFSNSAGGIGGRHLILSSMGVAIIAVWAVSPSWKIKKIFAAVVLIFLIACQGNAWIQAVACRINFSVLKTMEENRRSLSEADNIIFDASSFEKNIKYTWIKRDFNVFNTYYGSQAFEQWGIVNLLRLTLDDPDVSLYFAAESPAKQDQSSFKFLVMSQVGYRKVEKREVILPVKGTVIIDYDMVYSKGFNNGFRVGR